MENTIAPRFPPEIECRIFEVAARSALPFVHERINLLLVSKRTQHWINPILYRALVYTSPSTRGRFISSRNNPPVPPSKFHFIRQLYVYLEEIGDTPEILHQPPLVGCPNLTILCVWSGGCASGMFGHIIEGCFPFLEHLSIDLHRVFMELYSGSNPPSDLVRRGFGSLTHLQLLFSFPTVEMCSFFLQLSNLTHLGFLGMADLPRSTITTILSSSLGPRLKVLISSRLQHETQYRRECMDVYEETGVDEIRLVFLAQSPSTYIADCMKEMRGTGIGLWEFAEDIIEERMCKKAAKNAGEVQI
ncbi:hypothetical protein BDN72DRAFT_833517 [Pluteus cervinus]|uniref:Uncharacterized protein n=1 Tax=Pluteus cervinus TaxID=181527 RepID=A0ACD3B930_9AGAR|nr:hypothetical protein BDN72DRAFT_833517 [Pluteus cervinus]